VKLDFSRLESRLGRIIPADAKTVMLADWEIFLPQIKEIAQDNFQSGRRDVRNKIAEWLRREILKRQNAGKRWLFFRVRKNIFQLEVLQQVLWMIETVK